MTVRISQRRYDSVSMARRSMNLEVCHGQIRNAIRSLRPDDDTLADTEGWLDRWNDVVPRLGKGMNGWRIMSLCFFESPAYYYYRGQSDSDFCRRIATRAKQLADKYGVRVGYGNGLPY